MKKSLLTYLWLFTTCLALCTGCGLGNSSSAAPGQEPKPSPGTTSGSPEASRSYQRLVVLSDAHYPSKTLENKPEKRQQRINNKLKTAATVSAWDDVDLVVFTGDLVQLTGSAENYAWAREFTAKITKPQAIIAGNHEFIYEDQMAKGKLVRTDLAGREKKIKRFQEAFKLPHIYYTKELGRYLLIFLSPEPASGKYSTEISEQQLHWLDATLTAHPRQPALIFFHGPLEGTLANYNKSVNTPNSIAQPAAELEKVLLAHPQVILWVSGHTHTKATNSSFANPVNYYHQHILDVHNPTLDGDTIWTNSLYLYPDKIVIKTFNHAAGAWMDELTRTVTVKEDGTAVVPYQGAASTQASAPDAVPQTDKKTA